MITTNAYDVATTENLLNLSSSLIRFYDTDSSYSTIYEGQMSDVSTEPATKSMFLSRLFDSDYIKSNSTAFIEIRNNSNDFSIHNFESDLEYTLSRYNGDYDSLLFTFAFNAKAFELKYFNTDIRLGFYNDDTGALYELPFTMTYEDINNTRFFNIVVESNETIKSTADMITLYISVSVNYHRFYIYIPTSITLVYQRDIADVIAEQNEKILQGIEDIKNGLFDPSEEDQQAAADLRDKYESDANRAGQLIDDLTVSKPDLNFSQMISDINAYLDFTWLAAYLRVSYDQPVMVAVYGVLGLLLIFGYLLYGKKN